MAENEQEQKENFSDKVKKYAEKDKEFIQGIPPKVMQAIEETAGAIEDIEKACIQRGLKIPEDVRKAKETIQNSKVYKDIKTELGNMRQKANKKG